MRSPNPTLPSITFVLSQTQLAGKRPKGRRVRRAKSSPSFAPHPPRYPPHLDNDFLTTVDYRFSNPPRPPSRSSFALPKYIFDDDAEIEIMAPSPTESEVPSSTASTANRARQRARAVAVFMQDALYALRTRWRGLQPAQRAEGRIPFDLCN
ncbi:hypothetical protein BC834DRAFT_52156 [Gloeopeniophorella convolvens]|nr:hypothetical protein BC834DRAFT_52156 [Gloeopeniophorella convolvens]